MKRLILELSDLEHTAIKVKAAKEGKPMRALITTIIRKWLKEGK